MMIKKITTLTDNNSCGRKIDVLKNIFKNNRADIKKAKCGHTANFPEDSRIF